MSPSHANESDMTPSSPGEGGDEGSLADATHLCPSWMSLRCLPPCSPPPSALHTAGSILESQYLLRIRPVDPGACNGKVPGWEAGDLSLILARPRPSCVDLDKSLNFSGPRCSPMTLLLLFFFKTCYFVLGYSQNNVMIVSANSKGTQPYLYMYPFSPKFPPPSRPSPVTMF